MSLVISLVVCAGTSCVVAEEEPKVPEPELGADSYEPDEAHEPPRVSGDGPSFAERTAERVDQIREEARDCCPAHDDRPAPPVDPSLNGDERAQRARELFSAGFEAFRDRDYVRAAEAFEASYAHAPDRHVLAYNIARAWLGAEDCCRARRAMLRFIELAPDEPAIEQARETLDQLECAACP